MNDNPGSRAPLAGGPPSDSNTRLAKERTSFAKFRTQLALDRTTLAWIRTALTMATFGFGTVGFFRSLRLADQTPASVELHLAAIRMGVGLVVLGIAATVLAGVAHWRALGRLRRDEPPVVSRWPLSLTVAVLLTIVGVAALWDLLSR